MRILIIEDEFKLAELMEARLKKEKYLVDISLDGEIGLYNALNDNYDLILLDVMLPKINGFDILKQIRGKNIKAEVIMVTARGNIDDKLEGFEIGASDYITKPFNLEELVARVNARLRKESKNKNILEFADLKLNISRTLLKCTTSDEEIEVINKELLLLECLITKANHVVSKTFLYDNIWGLDNESFSNNLEAYISFIRKKIKTIGSEVEIKAIRGIGYKLEVSK